MAQPVFHITGQVISFFSLLIMIATIIFSLRKRIQAGYPMPPWVLYIYIFLALDALVGLILTGFQLADTFPFYSGRRIFSLFSILFIFLAVFDFPLGNPDVRFARERMAVFIFMGAQMALNAGWLVLRLLNPADAEKLTGLDGFRNLLLPLSFLWLALLAVRRGRVLQAGGELAAGKTLTRFSWFFWLGVLLSTTIALRHWLPFASQAHVTASSYGWMILCAGTALVFLGFGREKPVLNVHITLLVLVVLLLALGLVAEILSSNLGNLETPTEMDRLFRPFILVQVGMVLFVFLVLPRWLETMFPEKAQHAYILIKPLTSRQQEVMRLLANGQSNPQIAAALHVTEETVKYHVSKIMAEQDKRNRHELGELARRLLKGGEL
jgi:DNA-binding CsgD family transcriptional regulator